MQSTMFLPSLSPRRRPTRRAAFLISLVCTCLAILIVVPPEGRSHEPITTKVTFNKEVVRILQRSCLACHGQNSLTGISLTTYNEARPWAKAIKEEVLEKRMPPYQAVKGYGRFHNSYGLSQREIELIISWVEGGAPKGDDKDYPKELAEAHQHWPLGQPDLILQPASEIKLPAESEDEYRCFTLPTNLSEDRWLAAVDFQPGNQAVVHCASLYLDRTTPSQMIEAASQGVSDCQINSINPVADKLGQWVPGQMATRLPDGVALLLPANSRLLLKLHYKLNGVETSDRTAVGLYFATGKVAKPLRAIALTAPDTTVPAGVGAHRIKVSHTLPEAAEVIAIRPLLYPYGKSVEAKAIYPDGTSEVLIWVKNYRYDWQPTYYFKSAVKLPKGARIEVNAYLDNSDNNRNNPNRPPKSIRFAGELCELLLATAAR